MKQLRPLWNRNWLKLKLKVLHNKYNDIKVLNFIPKIANSLKLIFDVFNNVIAYLEH